MMPKLAGRQRRRLCCRWLLRTHHGGCGVSASRHGLGFAAPGMSVCRARMAEGASDALLSSWCLGLLVAGRDGHATRPALPAEPSAHQVRLSGPTG